MTETTLSSDYTTLDISHEEYREIFFVESGVSYRIDTPMQLITRKGGATHRVVDRDGQVHCYVAPESGKTVITWKSIRPTKPVSF